MVACADWLRTVPCGLCTCCVRAFFLRCGRTAQVLMGATCESYVAVCSCSASHSAVPHGWLLRSSNSSPAWWRLLMRGELYTAGIIPLRLRHFLTVPLAALVSSVFVLLVKSH
jgi:hypothetical protein